MSVIVKNMEMPKNCAMCEMWSICECLKEYKDYESILYAVDDGDLVRADECPLVDIAKEKKTNAEKFSEVFGFTATELWAKPENEFLDWLNAEVTE